LVVYFFLPLDLDLLFVFFTSFDLFLDDALLFTDFDFDLDFKSLDLDLDFKSLDLDLELFDLAFPLLLLSDLLLLRFTKMCPYAIVCCIVLVPDNFFD
jgi:hypothetical protein